MQLNIDMCILAYFHCGCWCWTSLSLSLSLKIVQLTLPNASANSWWCVFSSFGQFMRSINYFTDDFRYESCLLLQFAVKSEQQNCISNFISYEIFRFLKTLSFSLFRSVALSLCAFHTTARKRIIAIAATAKTTRDKTFAYIINSLNKALQLIAAVAVVATTITIAFSEIHLFNCTFESEILLVWKINFHSNFA